MNVRNQIILDEEMQRLAEQRAAERGVSVADYMRQLLADDLDKNSTRSKPEMSSKPDISIFFDLVTDGPATNIARDKDKMIGEAVWEEYLQSVGRKPSRSRPRKRS